MLRRCVLNGMSVAGGPRANPVGRKYSKINITNRVRDKSSNQVRGKPARFLDSSISLSNDDEEEVIDALKFQNNINVKRRKESSTQYFESENEPNRSYNYGLSGVGKVSPKKLIKPLQPMHGEMLYGIHPTLFALTSNRRKVHKLYVRDSLVDSSRPFVDQLLSVAREKCVPHETCGKALLDSLCQARPHQGVCLDVERLNFEELTSLNMSEVCQTVSSQLWIILDSVQDPMNFGAVIRSAYFLGVDNIFVVKENSCSLTPVVSKASSGAMEMLKIYSISDLSTFIQTRRSEGWSVFGTGSSAVSSHAEKLVSVRDVTLRQNTILILGNEGAGLSKDVVDQCDKLLTIRPGRELHPLIDSLNVSVATGILLNELCSSRNKGK